MNRTRPAARSCRSRHTLPPRPRRTLPRATATLTVAVAFALPPTALAVAHARASNARAGSAHASGPRASSARASDAHASSARPRASTSAAQRLSLKRTSVGSILVDSSGFTVYRFSKDSGARNSCASSRECNATWPPLTSSGKPSAGPGVKASLISTIALRGGVRQVTYAGHPLYVYEPASERAETSYVGVRQFGGTWLAVNASGGGVK